LVSRVPFLLIPCAWLTFVFLVDLAISRIIAPPAKGAPTGSLAVIFNIFLALGVQSVVQSLPFGFALGLSRRSYYLGTVLLEVALAVSAA
jgi:hypothetical protein